MSQSALDLKVPQVINNTRIQRSRLDYEFVYFYPPARALVPTDWNEIYVHGIPSFGLAPVKSFYFHIPFCTGRCTYCHYARWPRRPSDVHSGNTYLKLLATELATMAQFLPIERVDAESVHVGGGTPTFLMPDQIGFLMATVREHIQLSPSAEITWESSPETLLDRPERLDVLQASGVNRLSIGVQAFDDALLRIIGRRHSAGQAVTAYQLARRAGFRNINVDLIYGLPDQTLSRWEGTLDVVGKLLPESVTIYQLRVKPGTPMARLDSERFPDQGMCLEMGRSMLKRMKTLGYQAWQPNQFVRDDSYAHTYLRSKWREPTQLIGVGVSAYSFVGDWMYINRRDLDGYGADVKSGKLPIYLGKKLSVEQQRAKEVVLGIKVLPNGVQKERFARRFGITIDEVYGDVIHLLAEAGVVESTPDVLRLTQMGMLLADEVCTMFYAEEDRKRLKEIGGTKYGSYLSPVD